MNQQSKKISRPLWVTIALLGLLLTLAACSDDSDKPLTAKDLKGAQVNTSE